MEASILITKRGINVFAPYDRLDLMFRKYELRAWQVVGETKEAWQT